jgi:hypothetical protein
MDLFPGRVIVQAAQRRGCAAIAVGDMEIAKRNMGEAQEVSDRLITEIEGKRFRRGGVLLGDRKAPASSPA